jgi:60 kDa SS-A/Ro ribonucleoprotein
MVNRNLFKTKTPPPVVDTTNKHGAPAYSLKPEEALAQMASTGCLSDTYYMSAKSQLDDLIKTARLCSPAYVAQTAIWAREKGLMKDTPAVLVALLCDIASQHPEHRPIFVSAFKKVIDNTKMLANFVQVIRSGAVGRKSFGTTAKKLIQNWLNEKPCFYILRNSIGNSPSLGDIIRMTHPKAATPDHAGLYGWLIGKENENPKPEALKNYEKFKADLEAGKNPDIPANVPPEMISGLNGMGVKQWKQLATAGNWHFVRMNLNTFQRHEALSADIVAIIAEKLGDPATIEKINVFPYQILTTYQNTTVEDQQIHAALAGAMENATKNVPTLPGNIIVAVDESGSMGAPITGMGTTKPSKTHCSDVAALIAACIHRKNPTTGVIKWANDARWFQPNNGEPILQLAARMAGHGGGTNMSSVFQLLIKEKKAVDTLVIVSDNMSWADFHGYEGGRATASRKLWETLKKTNPKARLVLIDLTPNDNTQLPNDKDVMNIGGFSDAVFDLLKDFIEGNLSREKWVGEIKKIKLD